LIDILNRKIILHALKPLEICKFIVSSQHIHLDADNCFEAIVIKGKSEKIKELAQKLKSTKGVKYSSLTVATTGKNLT